MTVSYETCFNLGEEVERLNGVLAAVGQKCEKAERLLQGTRLQVQEQWQRAEQAEAEAQRLREALERIAYSDKPRYWAEDEARAAIQASGKEEEQG